AASAAGGTCGCYRRQPRGPRRAGDGGALGELVEPSLDLYPREQIVFGDTVGGADKRKDLDLALSFDELAQRFPFLRLSAVMTVGAFGPKGHDHLRPMAAKAAHQVAQEPFLDPLDLFDFLQRAIRVVEYFQEGDAQLTGSVAKLELAHIGQLAEVAGRSPVPE